MNNVSATSSTEFIQQHLADSHILRPLTMVLKQWLFQRKMNEVYTRGGLSSYALFLLVLTIVHRGIEASSNEMIGRFLLQFLRQWGNPTAFAEVIRPLQPSLDKSALDWEDMYQPFSLCIQDPVNEDNCIGRQTFSIHEIQQEWQLSANALSVAIDEYEMDINGGRERSLLASIVGLTTRYSVVSVNTGNMNVGNGLMRAIRSVRSSCLRRQSLIRRLSREKSLEIC
jgi:non-canonical poly(A) RNA polymerase PAPD5/7